MNIKINPFVLWRKCQEQEQIINKQCKQLMFNMQLISELFAEIAKKDKRIEQLEKSLDKHVIRIPRT